MKSFSERDVRRHYDLLQHRPELGLTQMKATDGEHVIGIGLFDNEPDFVSECRRYNGLGTLSVGVNPRSNRLLHDYGGLKNRIRTLFMDVVEEGDIDYVTGLAVRDPERLARPPRKYLRDASVFADGEVFFPLDKAAPVSRDSRHNVRRQLDVWLFGADRFRRDRSNAIRTGCGNGDVRWRMVQAADGIQEISSLHHGRHHV